MEVVYGRGGNPFPPPVVQKQVTIGRENIALKPSSFSAAASGPGMVYLDFDNGQSRGGAVTLKNYKSVELPGAQGKAASFEQPGHEVLVQLPEQLFHAQESDGKSFSIFFLIRPYQLRSEMPVMRREGIFEGKRQGFFVNFRSERIVFEFRNFFSDGNRVLPLLSIGSRDAIDTRNFHSVLLTYSEVNSTLTLYLDNVEQERIFVTDTGIPDATRFHPIYHKWDRSPLIIGRGLLAAIDEVILSNEVLDKNIAPGRFPGVERYGSLMRQKPGVYVSPVFDARHSDSRLLAAGIEKNEPSGTRILFEVRSSDSPGLDSMPESFKPFQTYNGGDQIRGRYFQYRLRLYADSNGEKTPEVKRVFLNVDPNLPPAPPRGLMVVNSESDEVTLRFMRNTEMDVIQGGQYYIYYGLNPNEPLGLIRYARVDAMSGVLSPINDRDFRVTGQDPRYHNYLEFTITNDVIMQNLDYARKDPRLIFEYPLLQPNIPYYFWVTAVDASYDEKDEHFDHESKASEAVFVRLKEN